jgi:hypothetical protein
MSEHHAELLGAVERAVAAHDEAEDRLREAIVTAYRAEVDLDEILAIWRSSRYYRTPEQVAEAEAAVDRIVGPYRKSTASPLIATVPPST